MTSMTLIGLVGVAAAGLLLLGCFRRERVLQDVALGELARVRVPEDLRFDANEAEATQDYAAFVFLRKHDSHINGYTSYAERLQITIFAEDLELERIERGTHEFGYAAVLTRPKDDVVEQVTASPLQWKITREMYDRDPVHEPSWRILVLDRERRILFDWRGFQKQYRVDAAKSKVQSMLETLSLQGKRTAFFAARRSWSADTRRENYAANVAALQEALGRLEMGKAVEGEWRTAGPWRLAIDRERPQRFLLVRRLAMAEKPDGMVNFRGPVTRYSFVRQYLRQENQGGGGGLLPPELLEGMRGEFADPAAVYYYSVQTLDLWNRHESMDAELNEMQRKFGDLAKAYEAGLVVTPYIP